VALSDSSEVEVNVIKVEEKKITQVAKFTSIPDFQYRKLLPIKRLSGNAGSNLHKV
jgi:hypothetical protein